MRGEERAQLQVGPTSPGAAVSPAEGGSVSVLVFKLSDILERLLAQLNSSFDQPEFWRQY